MDMRRNDWIRLLLCFVVIPAADYALCHGTSSAGLLTLTGFVGCVYWGQHDPDDPPR